MESLCRSDEAKWMWRNSREKSDGIGSDPTYPFEGVSRKVER